MRRRWWVALPFALSMAAATHARGGEMPDGLGAFAMPSDPIADARALADVIDRLIAAKWAEAGVEPAPPADDAEFLRRASLDLAGNIPTSAEVRDFLDDRSPDKRRALVERLFKGPGYLNHQTETWKDLLVPEARNNNNLQFYTGDFATWLREQFAKETPYDQVVRQVLTASVGGRNMGFNAQSKPSPFAFYAAKDAKPENLAAGATRLFLGIRLECAQCHDHPFAKWKKDEFWGMAAFFAGIQRQGDGDFFQGARETPDRHEIKVPNTEKVVRAKFLDGAEPKFKPRAKPREALADWLVAPENPYFARAAANRAWAQFFGTGLVDPIDDMEATNTPSHPELLDLLAREFAAHKFDLKYLMRAIAYSRTYGLASTGYSPGQDDPRLFAKAAIRGMTPLQLYEAFVRATGVRREPEPAPFFFVNDSPRKDFLDRFADDARPTEHQTSILQALTLMNGRLVADATSLERGGTLPAIADAFWLDAPGKVEAMYLATLGRRPRPEELDPLVEYVERGGPNLNPKKAYADIFWALINSAEFTLNH